MGAAAGRRSCLLSVLRLLRRASSCEVVPHGRKLSRQSLLPLSAQLFYLVTVQYTAGHLSFAYRKTSHRAAASRRPVTLHRHDDLPLTGGETPSQSADDQSRQATRAADFTSDSIFLTADRRRFSPSAFLSRVQ